MRSSTGSTSFVNGSGFDLRDRQGFDVSQDRPEILRVATAVRQSMAASGFFMSFPRNQCDNASRLLALYLFEQGAQDVWICRGHRRGYRKRKDIFHLWVELHGWCIDITGDQFEGENRPSIAVDADRNWFESWQLLDRYPADDEWRNILLQSYVELPLRWTWEDMRARIDRALTLDQT